MLTALRATLGTVLLDRAARSLSTIAPAVFLLYLSSYLLVSYETHFHEIALHSLVLVPGVLLALWLILPGLGSRPGPVQKDRTLLVAAALLFFLSVLVINGPQSSQSILRAYAVGFFCYFFVRVVGERASHSILVRMFALYLIASGLLALLQVLAGDAFYVARYFTLGVYMPYAVGFATTPNMGAVLMLWPLAVLMADLIGMRSVRPLDEWVQWAGLACGNMGIYFTLSFAAWTGIVIVSIALLFRARLPATRKRAGIVVAVAAASFLVAHAIPSSVDRYVSVKLRGELPPFVASPDSRLGVFAPVLSSYSHNTRLFSLYVAKEILHQKPFWGVGSGQYPSHYAAHHRELPALYRARLDPRPNMTPHNALVQYATEVGLLPTVPLLFLIGWVLRRGLSADLSAPVLTYAVGLVGVLTWMLFHDLLFDRLFWIALALCVAFLNPPLPTPGVSRIESAARHHHRE